MFSNIKVEIAYAVPERQYLLHVILIEGATIEEAIKASGLLKIRREINLIKNKVGIYGSLANLTDLVKDGDRVEIYRPLIIDPKELRHQRITEANRKHL